MQNKGCGPQMKKLPKLCKPLCYAALSLIVLRFVLRFLDAVFY